MINNIEPDEYLNSYESEYTESDYNDELSLSKNKSYIILREKDFEILRNKLISLIEDFTYSTRDEAILILLSFQWNIDIIKEKWYDNVQIYKEIAGIELSEESKKILLQKKVKNFNTECLICFEEKIKCNEFIRLNCNHGFCDLCYTEHIKSKLTDPYTSMYIRCPQAYCNLLIPESIILKLLEKDEKNFMLFRKCVYKNFTDYNSDIKWCPNQGCDACVRCESKCNKEVFCICGHCFCFKCQKDGHRPCPCDMVEAWDIKNNSEGENIKWIKINTKQCPKCKKHIEKNQGCDHMTCREAAGGCGYEFCWICLSDWKGHNNCNKFVAENLDKEKEIIKSELNKFMHYFNRFYNHMKGYKLSLIMKNSIEYSIHSINKFKNIGITDLVFLRSGVETIIRSRRLLKNSYIFGYYLKNNIKEKDLFEHNQLLLENNTDRLHELLENDTLTNIVGLSDFSDFNNEFYLFRSLIIDLYSATDKYIDNLLSSIENNMNHLIDFILFDEYKK